MTATEFVAEKQALRQASEDELRRFLRDTGSEAFGDRPTTPERWQACFLAWQYARRGRVTMVEA